MPSTRGASVAATRSGSGRARGEPGSVTPGTEHEQKGNGAAPPPPPAQPTLPYRTEDDLHPRAVFRSGNNVRVKSRTGVEKLVESFRAEPDVGIKVSTEQ
jgi:hypothetical protein